MPRSSQRPSGARPDLRPWEWLYDIVGVGMWAVTRTRFDVQVLGGPIPQVDRGQLWVASHRAETDVPLIGGLLTIRGGMLRRSGARLHFAARDDLFVPGVMSAGLHLPRPLAQMAWSLTPGPWLPRVRAHPIRRPVGLKLSQALDGISPDVALAEVLTPQIVTGLAQRAAIAGRPPPQTVGQVRDAAFARDLWRDITVDDLGGPRGGEVWRAHVARAASDLRRLIDLVRHGEPLLLFPEGRVSPEGGIGPVGDVLDLIIRRGAPTSILPIGIAYDPLRHGRGTVAVNVGSPVTTGAAPFALVMSDLLRRSTPITVGQVLARELTAAAASGCTTIASRHMLEVLAATHERARREGRPTVRGLRSPGRRARSLASAVQALQARGLACSASDGSSRIDPDAVLADVVVQRLAQEDRAVWQRDATPPDP